MGTRVHPNAPSFGWFRFNRLVKPNLLRAREEAYRVVRCLGSYILCTVGSHMAVRSSALRARIPINISWY
jgi:hypothetical protein